MRTIAIVNQKGGCGKTTTAINLAGALARRGQATLLIDLDPQSHCAAGLGVPESRIERHVGDAMLTPTASAIERTGLVWPVSKHLDLVPSSIRLAGLEAARGGLATLDDRDTRLLRVVRALTTGREAPDYGCCIIDCPPTIGLLTYNALRAADEVIIPVETSFFAMRGAERQVQTVQALTKRFGKDLPYHVLPTMHDDRSPLARRLLDEVRRTFGERVLPSVIRLDMRLREAAAAGRPIVELAPDTAGSEDYARLAQWALGEELTPLRVVAAEQPPESAETAAPPCSDRVDSEGAEPERSTNDTADVLLSRAAEMAARIRSLSARSDAYQARLAREIPSDSPTETIDRLFRVQASALARVFIAGDFNGWSPAATPLRYNASNGWHETRVSLPAGRQRYRFIVDGKWTSDPNADEESAAEDGSPASIVVVRPRAPAPLTPPRHSSSHGASDVPPTLRR
ncbi:MAG: AAA family ATPase [Phycisphaerales bacterium]